MNAQTRPSERHRPPQRCWFRHRFRWLSRRRRSCPSRWHRASTVVLFTGVITAGTGPGFDTVPSANAAVAGWCANSLRPADAWNTFAADVSVKRLHLTKDGNPIGAPTPNATYRIERSSRSGGWKTVVTNLSLARAPMYALSGALLPTRPLPVSRVEDDENGTPLRAYDASGALLTPQLMAQTTSPNASPRSTGLSWLDSFVAAPSKKGARQLEFEKAYGKATKVGQLNRYVRLVTDGSDEVLVDLKTVVPVEANALRKGKRVGHRTFTYGPAPDSALVRSNIHADTVVSADSGDRTVVDTTFSNVCLEMRR